MIYLTRRCGIGAIAIALAVVFARADALPSADRQAGVTVDGRTIEADGKLVHSAGDELKIPGKPSDMILSPGGRFLLVKTGKGLSVVDPKTYAVTASLSVKELGGSMHGLIAAPVDGGGCTAYFTSAGKQLMEVKVAADGSAEWGRRIPLTSKHAWGMAISADNKLAYICMSMESKVAIVDLQKGEITGTIPVGVAPYDISISPDGHFAYVTNYGGHPPAAGEASEKSAGVDVAVDKRAISTSGTVSKIDLQSNKMLTEMRTGLHPTQIIRDSKGTRYFVANANSDSISIIDSATDKVTQTLEIRPDANLPFGSIPNALELSADEKTLFVANGGNDAVAVVSFDTAQAQLRGFIPSGWFPGALLRQQDALYIANTLGGTLSRVTIPSGDQLATYTKQVLADEQVPHILAEVKRGELGGAPVPVPQQFGQPSVFKHVVYILKENKTYDEVLGDIGKGNSDPKLCTYGQAITPNHHALANQFVLLDNYYCNGVNSSEGHQWATQGIIGDYFEKGSRTYDFGTDALCYTSNDFIWDSCLLHGLSIRNYGEFDFPEITSKSKKWFDVYRDWEAGKVTVQHSLELETLNHFSCQDYPGWNLDFPDVFRAKIFMKELAGFEKSGELPNFLLVYLPQDHTAGRGQAVPAPRAMVADNDLATGQVVEAISKSKFWKDTCIFINEDDPQSGYDHVDGHRSFCLVVSPYTKREAIVSKFYNQTSVLHTMTQILGLPPLNQQCAAASTMEDCFTSTSDLRPYTCVTNTVALDERNPKKQAMGPTEQKLADAVDLMDFTKPDLADQNVLNRLNWIASGHTEAYPAEYSGPHGKGLKALHLVLDKSSVDPDGDGD